MKFVVKRRLRDAEYGSAWEEVAAADSIDGARIKRQALKTVDDKYDYKIHRRQA